MWRTPSIEGHEAVAFNAVGSIQVMHSSGLSPDPSIDGHSACLRKSEEEACL